MFEITPDSFIATSTDIADCAYQLVSHIEFAINCSSFIVDYDICEAGTNVRCSRLFSSLEQFKLINDLGNIVSVYYLEASDCHSNTFRKLTPIKDIRQLSIEGKDSTEVILTTVDGDCFHMEAFNPMATDYIYYSRSQFDLK